MDDDLNTARLLLNVDVGTDEAISYSLRAIAHTLLWQAEQHRNWQRRIDENARKLKEWHESQPTPPPPMPAYPMPYQGF